MPESFISKRLHVCNCGPDCECGYSSAIASTCGCNVPTVERRVLAEDTDNFYVSQTGKMGKAYDTLGSEPFTTPDGKPLQRFPKNRYVTSSEELKSRAQKGIGDLSQQLSTNYEAEDIPPAEHSHHGNISIREAEHRGKKIVIKTTYDITIDGKPLENHLMVDDRGRVHSHGLPNYAYASMTDLVKRLIDAEQDLPVSSTDSEATDFPQPHIHGGHH